MNDPVQCGIHYMKTGNVPPVNLFSWVHVYNIVVNCSMSTK